MAYTVKIGGIRCHILSDGLNAIDGGGWFGLVPRVLWERVIQPDELNRVPADSRALLIEADTGLILVDTGNGDKILPRHRQNIGLSERNRRLVADLARVGFAPEDVDLLVLTHFHGDHIGGNTHWDTPDGSPGPAVLTFPNARTLGQRIDLAEASFPNERTRATYNADNWQPIMDRGLFDVVDGPQRLARGVRTEIAPGHTASVQTIWVEDGGESLCFLSDAASWAVHLDRLAWVPSYDLDPMTSIETKRRLRMAAQERETLLVFQHDPVVVTGRVVEGARGPQVQPEITEEPWFDPATVE
jgi:glyoxylase-like metal-dependent hydrolase (beta-lactamase superfamily II)